MSRDGPQLKLVAVAHAQPAVAVTRLNVPDNELVSRAAGGEHPAFEELVRRHAGRLHSVVYRLGLPREMAEEVVQEAFLRAWRGLGSFRGGCQFSTWLYRIGCNEAQRRLAHERPRIKLLSGSEPDPDVMSDPRSEPHFQLAQVRLRQALAESVGALPLIYRAPLVLRDIEGLSTADAAAILGIGQSAFKSRLHRARVAVRDALTPILDDESAPTACSGHH